MGVSRGITVIYNILTFPGIIVHEISHILFCNLTGTKIHDYKLFQIDVGLLFTRWGYVSHEQPDNAFEQLGISFGPLIFNSLLAMFITIFAILFSYLNPWAGWFFIWLGFSIGAHAFPSFGDGNVLLKTTIDGIKEGKLLSVVYLPFSLFTYIASLASVFWLDAVYAGLLLFLIIGFSGLPVGYNLNDGVSFSIEYDVGFDDVFPAAIFDDHFFVLEECWVPDDPDENIFCDSEKISREDVADKEEHTIKALIGGECREWIVSDSDLKRSIARIKLELEDSRLRPEETCNDLIVESLRYIIEEEE